jgi:hypothetical protein
MNAKTPRHKGKKEKGGNLSAFLRISALVDMLQKLVGKIRFSRDFVAQASSL